MRKNLNLRTNIALGLIFAFLANTLGPVPLAQADEFRLPAPGVRVNLSPEFNPPILKGIKVHPDNPFRFDFILDQGDSSNSPSLVQRGGQGELKQEATKLIKYFLASLTIPEKDLWVNLSPYEKDRIIPQSFGLTEMGRDLLAEDYMLKQITASLIYPEGETGKKFWKRIYEEAYKKFGTTNIPVNTFNKVWIVPEKAVVYENAKAGTAYVVEAKLKVMLEQDYLALSHNVIPAKAGIQKNDINRLGSQIVRETQSSTLSSEKRLGSLLAKSVLQEIVIPELTKEVNENKNFAQLRQVYNSLILATWYKKKIKDSILARVYDDKNKIQGLVIPAKAGIQNKNDVEFIYQRYLQAFKKGVYNYIKEDQDPLTQETIPRKYFSGGITDLAMNIAIEEVSIKKMRAVIGDNNLLATVNMEMAVTSDLVDSVMPVPAKDHAMAVEGRLRMDDQDVQRFFVISEYNKSLFPIYVSYTQPGKVLYFDRFPLTQVQDFWKEGSVQAFRSNTRHILFMWAPGKRNEWQKKTGQSVKQEMRVPSNRPVRIRFIDTVEILIGPDKYKVWVDEAKNIKIQHVEDLKGMLTGEPVSIPWEEKRSVIKKGSFKFSRGNKGEYRMDYMFSQSDSILRWESMPTSTFDYEGVYATGNTGKHNEDFGFVDASKGALALISGPTTITGIAAKTIQSSVSRTEFTQLNLNKVQSFLEEIISQVQQDIKDYRIGRLKARKKDGVSISLAVIVQDAKERGLLVGVNAGNILFLRRHDKRTDLLSNDVEAGALGAQDTTREQVLGNFIRSVNPGDMVVAVPSGILASKIVERIISENDDPEEIRNQLMEKAKAVSDAREETNKMTVAVLKISSDLAMAAKADPTDIFFAPMIDGGSRKKDWTVAGVLRRSRNIMAILGALYLMSPPLINSIDRWGIYRDKGETYPYSENNSFPRTLREGSISKSSDYFSEAYFNSPEYLEFSSKMELFLNSQLSRGQGEVLKQIHGNYSRGEYQELTAYIRDLRIAILIHMQNKYHLMDARSFFNALIVTNNATINDAHDAYTDSTGWNQLSRLDLKELIFVLAHEDGHLTSKTKNNYNNSTYWLNYFFVPLGLENSPSYAVEEAKSDFFAYAALTSFFPGGVDDFSENSIHRKMNIPEDPYSSLYEKHRRARSFIRDFKAEMDKRGTPVDWVKANSIVNQIGSPSAPFINDPFAFFAHHFLSSYLGVKELQGDFKSSSDPSSSLYRGMIQQYFREFDQSRGNIGHDAQLIHKTGDKAQLSQDQTKAVNQIYEKYGILNSGLKEAAGMISTRSGIFYAKNLLREEIQKYSEILKVYDSPSLTPLIRRDQLVAEGMLMALDVPDGRSSGFLQSAQKMLEPLVQPGSTVVSVGPGGEYALMPESGHLKIPRIVWEQLALELGAKVKIYEPQPEYNSGWKEISQKYKNMEVVDSGEARFEKSDLTDGSVDVVVMMSVLSDYTIAKDTRSEILVKAVKSLRPGGSLIIGYYKQRYNGEEKRTEDLLGSVSREGYSIVSTSDFGEEPENNSFGRIWKRYIVERVANKNLSKTGGIDLTPANMNLQTKMDSRFRGNDNRNGIQFHMDAAMLQQLQNAPGFTPVIINIQPLKNLSEFLGLNGS